MRSFLRVLPIAAIVSVVVPMMAPASVAASPVDQQRDRVESIVDELERLEERARLIGEQYVEALDSKSQLDDEIVEAEQRVAEKEAELERLRGNLGEMALRSFVGGGAAPLGPLFEDSANLNDALQRDELARVALSVGNVTSDELDQLVADLEDERDDLDQKRSQAEALAASLVDAQEETERLTSEYQQARVDAEARLGELIVEEEARRAAESAARLRAEVAAQSQANSGGGGGGGSTGGGGSGGGSTGGNSSGGGSTGGSTTASSGGSAAPAAAPAVSSRSGIAVQAALGQQGVPYRYATSNPGVSFDCSGLTAYAWGQAGVGLPHQSRMQYASVPHVSKSQAQPGDLIFFYSPISHVSIYLGGGQHIHAPNTGSVVSIGNVNWNKVTGVGRPG
ncbi:MAG: C40 family peptidase [Ilumatobacteraceae bacterium]|nr:C40 family peptidase [Ilumatobacteraceae bacterium]